MRIQSLIILSMLVGAAGCSRAPVLTITNESSLTLSNVVVSGSGFSEHVGNIAAGGERQLSVRLRGESGVRLVFDAGPQHVDSGERRSGAGETLS
jgi:hypothetical protein